MNTAKRELAYEDDPPPVGSIGARVSVEYEEKNGASFPISYNCTKFLQDNPTTVRDVILEYYYDMQHDIVVPYETARLVTESRLLTEVATEFGISTGVSCQEPPLDTFWAVRAASDPVDEPNYQISQDAKCLELKSNNNTTSSSRVTCVTMIGKMTLGIAGPIDEDEAYDFIRTVINSGVLSDGSTSKLLFLGTGIEDNIFGGKDKLPPAVNESGEEIQSNKSSDDRKVTPEGAVFVIGLVAAFALCVFVLFRLRRRRKAAQNQAAITHAESMTPPPVQKNPSDQTFDLEKSAVQGFSNSSEEVAPIAAQTTEHNTNNNNNEPPFYYGEDLPEVEDDFRNAFSFEMGDVQRNELLGLHGNRPISGIQENGEVSESDVDSWAQTDASLGSIEMRLDPITAEV